MISIVVGEVVPHGEQEAVGILLGRDNGGFIFIGEFLVLVLDAFHEVVGAHEIDNAHPELAAVLDDEEGVVDDLVLAEEVHILLQRAQEAAVALLLDEVGVVVLVHLEIGVQARGGLLGGLGEEEPVDLRALEVVLAQRESLEAEEEVLHDHEAVGVALDNDLVDAVDLGEEALGVDGLHVAQVVWGELEELVELLRLDALDHQQLVLRFRELGVALAAHRLPELAVGQALDVGLEGDALGLAQALELAVVVGGDLVAITRVRIVLEGLAADLVDALLEIPAGGDILGQDEVELEGVGGAFLELLAEVRGVEGADEHGDGLLVVDQVEVESLPLLELVAPPPHLLAVGAQPRLVVHQSERKHRLRHLPAQRFQRVFVRTLQLPPLLARLLPLQRHRLLQVLPRGHPLQVELLQLLPACSLLPAYALLPVPAANSRRLPGVELEEGVVVIAGVDGDHFILLDLAFALVEGALNDAEDVNSGLEEGVDLGGLAQEVGPVGGVRVLLALLPPPQLLQVPAQPLEDVSDALQLLELDDEARVGALLEAEGLQQANVAVDDVRQRLLQLELLLHLRAHQLSDVPAQTLPVNPQVLLRLQVDQPDLETLHRKHLHPEPDVRRLQHALHAGVGAVPEGVLRGERGERVLRGESLLALLVFECFWREVCGVGDKVEEVVEAVLEVVLADLDLLGEAGSAGPALEVAEDVPVLLILLEVLVHLLDAQVLLVVDLARALLLHLPHRHLHAAPAEVVPLAVLQPALAAPPHQSRRHDQQEVPDRVVVLGVGRDRLVHSLPAGVQELPPPAGLAVLAQLLVLLLQLDLAEAHAVGLHLFAAHALETVEIARADAEQSRGVPAVALLPHLEVEVDEVLLEVGLAQQAQEGLEGALEGGLRVVGALADQQRVDADIALEVDEGVVVVLEGADIHEVERPHQLRRPVAVDGPDVLDGVAHAGHLHDPLQVLLLEPADDRDALLREEVEQLATGGVLDEHDVGIKLHDALLQLLVDGVFVVDQVLEAHLHARLVQRVLDHDDLRAHQPAEHVLHRQALLEDHSAHEFEVLPGRAGQRADGDLARDVHVAAARVEVEGQDVHAGLHDCPQQHLQQPARLELARHAPQLHQPAQHAPPQRPRLLLQLLRQPRLALALLRPEDHAH